MDFNSLDFGSVVNSINSELGTLIKKKQIVPELVFSKAPMMFASAVLYKNPFYADRALILCQMHNFPLTETMQKVVTASSLSRLSGSPLGTNDQITRAGQNEMACLWMAHLIAAGCNKQEASEKAAELYARAFPDKPKKASSISKEYDTQRWDKVQSWDFKGRTRQQVINEMHKINEPLKESWTQAAKTVPRTEEHKGERR